MLALAHGVAAYRALAYVSGMRRAQQQQLLYQLVAKIMKKHHQNNGAAAMAALYRHNVACARAIKAAAAARLAKQQRHQWRRIKIAYGIWRVWRNNGAAYGVAGWRIHRKSLSALLTSPPPPLISTALHRIPRSTRGIRMAAPISGIIHSVSRSTAATSWQWRRHHIKQRRSACNQRRRSACEAAKASSAAKRKMAWQRLARNKSNRAPSRWRSSGVSAAAA